MTRRGFVGFPWNGGREGAFGLRMNGLCFTPSVERRIDAVPREVVKVRRAQLDAVAVAIEAMGQMSTHLEHLNSAPYCIQHAIVSREKNDTRRPTADQEAGAERFTVSLEKMIRIVCVLEDRERLRADQDTPVHLFLPTLVIDTPKLFLYNATTSTTTEVDQLMRPLTVQADGRLQTRLVDVVTESGLDNWLEALARAWREFDREVGHCRKKLDDEWHASASRWVLRRDKARRLGIKSRGGR